MKELPDVIQKTSLILIDGHSCRGVPAQHVDKALAHARALHLGANLRVWAAAAERWAGVDRRALHACSQAAEAVQSRHSEAEQRPPNALGA